MRYLLLLFLAGCARPSVTGIPNFAVVDAQHNIYRGAQPTTKAQWDYLYSIGATNVIKLDDEREGADEVSLRFNVDAVPISDLEQMVGLPRSYLSTIVDSVHPNTYVHCLHGEDRTGIVCACYHVQAQHWSKAEAQRDMLSRGFHPELLGLWHAWQDFK
jgi:hypothetical protein